MPAPYYSRNGITIYCGDCLEIMPQLEPPFDAIIADLPYGTTACSWDSILPFDELWGEYKRLIKPNGVILLFGVMPFTAALWQSNSKYWRYEFVWRKNGSTRFLDANERPLLDYENIEVFYSCQPTYNPQKFKGEKTHGRGRSVGNKSNIEIYRNVFTTKSDQSGEKFPRLVLDFDKVAPSEILHPTQKPVALMSYLIRTYTNPGELILDNTMGSGTTLVAAQNEGRQAVGIELSEDYCKIAVERLRQQSLFTLPSNNGIHATAQASLPAQGSLLNDDDSGGA